MNVKGIQVVELLLSKYLNISKSNDQYRRLGLILITILSCTAISAFFTFYNLVIDYYPPLLYVDFIGTLLGGLSLYLFLRFRWILLSSFILILMVTGVCFMVMVDRNNLDYSLAWAFVAPLISIFLLGYLYGTLYSLLYLAFVMWLSGSNLGVWQPAPWDRDSFANIIAIYLLLFMLSCYYEASRRYAHQLLQESNDKLRTLASTDALTGLFNRRHMEDLLLNSKKILFIIMADVDNFKSINDEFGHAVGDEVLVSLGKVMQSVAGPDGTVGRWGGEEFIIAIHADQEKEVMRLPQRLLEAVSSHPFATGRPVTVSLGCAFHNAKEHRATLRCVDEALYSAKTSGKNCYKLVKYPL
ncbi:GGDEF domain-containing protein [Salinicola sp. DM10]|uniref:GGDEF domain-containing protein n=1 Tax=Salinicola sp. DM10 TaxID=2815721 RepID=UPI001A8F0248|nr:GGDEF domain-containing protein [Salinicola sp. DM10]MCE3026382.1 GGDEF domain-containing protein [Salinicola sp. DM10]